MKTLAQRLTVLIAAVASSTSAWSQDLKGKWDLNIEDMSHHIVTTLVVEFTERRATSCIIGNWMRVSVLSATSKDKQFFPLSDPLSFKVENDRLTIGRNEICDGYLMLSGVLNEEAVSGDYYSLGLEGSSPRGFFTLNRKKSAR